IIGGSGERLDRLDAGIAHRLNALAGHARDRDHWDSAMPRRHRDGMRELSVDALPVDATLTRDHERGAARAGLEADRVENEKCPRAEARIEEREQPRAQPAGSAG